MRSAPSKFSQISGDRTDRRGQVFQAGKFVTSGISSAARGSKTAYLPCRNQMVRRPSLFAGMISLSRRSPIMIASEGRKSGLVEYRTEESSIRLFDPNGSRYVSMTKPAANTPRSSQDVRDTRRRVACQREREIFRQLFQNHSGSGVELVPERPNLRVVRSHLLGDLIE